MIDLHCHILPGIDDGAVDILSSVELVKAAIDDGITHMMCTPHIQFGRFDNSVDSIKPIFNQLVSEVNSQGLNIELAFAAEVRICPEIMLLNKQGKLPFIGQWQGKNVVLLELPHSHVPAGTEQLIKWLFNQNIIPMIAHPERNRDIIADNTKLKPLQRLGCLFQLTASSLCGGFGSEIQTLAEKLILEDTITIIATDAHNMKRRPPNLSQARDAVTTLIGQSVANTLVYDNPKLISLSKFGLS